MIKKTLFATIISIIFTMPALAELRDPTRPDFYADAAKIQNGAFELTGIVTSNVRKVAIINGQLVKIGDQVENNTVIAIAPNTVQLEGPSGKITLLLIDPTVKKVSGNAVGVPANIQRH